MNDLLELLGGAGAWMPHGHCYLWQPGVLWLNLSSDVLIAAAYFSLPAALIYFVVKRRDLAFKPLFVMFGVFILACGMTHVMGAVTIWVPAYWLSGGVKAVTAAASLATAIMVWFYLPRALALPSPEQLHRINRDLEGLNRQLHDEITIRTEAEERFRSLLESAPDAIVIVDKNGCIELINQQAEKWFGYSREELLGRPVEVLVPDRFQQHHVTDRNTYIDSPVVRPMGAGLELFGRRKDGSEFPVEISLSPLYTNQGVLITSMIRDITARKQAEEAQRLVQSRYRDLVNNLPIGVYRNTDGVDGRFMEVNPALVDMLQADSAGELTSHSFSEFYADAAQRDMFLDKLMGNSHVRAEEIKLKTLKGREFYAAVTAVRKQDDEQGEYVDGILEDISERKEDEHQIQQLNESLRTRTNTLESINSELEAFSYSVSHDLRAPLRAIDGFSRILLRDYAASLDEKGKDLLDRVRKGAQNMSVLIDDLLKLSRVSRAELTYESVDLSALAREVTEALRQDDPGRKVQFDIAPNLNTEGDSRLLKVVLDNLIGNAWKFTRLKDDARIEVGVQQAAGSTTYYVRDNGAGFDMAYSDKLFGAFQRLHDVDTYAGSGIGLATTQRIIHKHGGTIRAESKVGEGATFYFTLNQGRDDDG